VYMTKVIPKNIFVMEERQVYMTKVIPKNIFVMEERHGPWSFWRHLILKYGRQFVFEFCCRLSGDITDELVSRVTYDNSSVQ